MLRCPLQSLQVKYHLASILPQAVASVLATAVHVVITPRTSRLFILLMEEILHHLGALNYCNSGDFRNLTWVQDFLHQQYQLHHPTPRARSSRSVITKQQWYKSLMMLHRSTSSSSRISSNVRRFRAAPVAISLTEPQLAVSNLFVSLCGTKSTRL